MDLASVWSYFTELVRPIAHFVQIGKREHEVGLRERNLEDREQRFQYLAALEHRYLENPQQSLEISEGDVLHYTGNLVANSQVRIPVCIRNRGLSAITVNRVTATGGPSNWASKKLITHDDILRIDPLAVGMASIIWEPTTEDTNRLFPVGENAFWSTFRLDVCVYTTREEGDFEVRKTLTYTVIRNFPLSLPPGN